MMDEQNMGHDHNSRAGEANGIGNNHSQPIFKKIDNEDSIDYYDVRKLQLGLQKHKNLILFFMLLFVGFGFMFSYKFLTTYQAEAMVLFREEKGRSDTLAGGYRPIDLGISTVRDMIKLQSHFKAVKSILGLDLSVKNIASMTSVPAPKNDSKLLSVVVIGDHPNLVVDIANTLARIAVRTSQEFHRKQLQIAFDSYKNQLAIVKERLSLKLQEIEDFKKLNQYFEMDAAHASLLAQFEGARDKSTEATIEYNKIQTEYENLKRQTAELPEVVPLTSAIKSTALHSQIVSLGLALAEARSMYTEDNPKVKRLELQIRELRQKTENGNFEEGEESFIEKNPLKEKLEGELIRMKGKVYSAEKIKYETALNVTQLERSFESLPAQQIAFVKLLYAKQIEEEQLSYLNEAVEKTQLSINIPKGSLELFSLAEKSSLWKDRWYVYVMPILCLIFGLGVGVGLALLIEIKDAKLRTANQIDLSYYLPCLLTIPEIDSLSSENAEQKTLFYVRNLSERLEKAAEGKTNLTLTLTSSIDNEGKSCLAYHLALYFGRLGKKVILLEADYHENAFSPKNSNHTLEQFLEGKANINEIIIPGTPNRIKVGKYHPHMKELIKTKGMADLWQSLKQNFDVIIIDAPGVIKDDYSTNLARLTDFCVFVIGSSIVDKNLVDESLTALNNSGIRPYGMVLNRIQHFYIDDERVKQISGIKRSRFFYDVLLGKR